MKISNLLETITPASSTANTNTSAPKFGRSDKFLEEETVEECTTAGSVASVATPVGGMQRRGKGSIFSGIKTSEKFPNSQSVKEVEEAVTLDRSKVPNYPNDVETTKHRIAVAKEILSDPKSDYDSRRIASSILAQDEKLLGQYKDTAKKYTGEARVGNRMSDISVGSPKIVNYKGKAVGEVGIDHDPSPGNGPYYWKHYLTGHYMVGYDTKQQALADLKHVVLQNEGSELEEGVWGDTAKLIGIPAVAGALAVGAQHYDDQQPHVQIGDKSVRYIAQPGWGKVPDDAMTLTGKDGKQYRVWKTSGKGGGHTWLAAPAEEVKESLADEFMKIAQAKGMNPRLRGTPEQERERTNQMIAQRNIERQEAEKAAAEQDHQQLPQLKAEYEQMKKEYESLGGSNWQYADREQNLTDYERKARSMEPALRNLGSRITRAEKTVDENIDFDQLRKDAAAGAAKTIDAATRQEPKKPFMAQVGDKIIGGVGQGIKGSYKGFTRDQEPGKPFMAQVGDKIIGGVGGAIKGAYKGFTGKKVEEEELDEKSKSKAQFRMMAAVANNPEFAKKVGISQKVGKEFHKADKKVDYSDLPAKVDEGEISEEMLAHNLYKDLQIFKKGKDKDIGAKAKNKDLSSKPSDKEIIAKVAKMANEDKDPCWKGYKQIGMKDKGGKKVPNCVPVKEEEVSEDWQKTNKQDKTDGMSPKAVKAYRRENPGSKLKTAVTTKPSKLKAGSKDAKRRKSFCARMSGNPGPMKDEHGKPTPKAKALKRWNC